jgi:hypothetical protein
MSDKTSTGNDKVLTNREWSDWKMIPGPNGAPFKVECLRAGLQPGHSERLTVWLDDDPRPHDHPWREFVSTVFSGGFTEVRFETVNGEVVRTEHQRRAGDTYTCPAGVVHMIINVLPGTRTHMMMTPNEIKWGSYNLPDLSPAVFNPVFLENLKALNSKPA